MVRSTRRAKRRPTRQAKATDALSAALASGAFATLVRYFTVHPERVPHIRALMRETGLNARSMQIEIARMESLGLVRRERSTDDRRVGVRLVPDHPAWTALRTLVRVLAQPEDVLKMTVAGLPHVAAAFVYGSVASGDAAPESDCDFMVVTAPEATRDDQHAIEKALAVQTGETSRALGRELQVVVYSARELRTRAGAGRGFVPRVMEGAKRWVVGSEGVLASLIAGAPEEGR
ncbi:MAG: nucleotidyltransferase domain-containing protein [Gemmatimonadaceae bacterium]